VRFGARVRAKTADGERSYRIVGVDEADASQDRIAFVSPLARALMGRGVGDEVRVRTPRGEETLEVLEISYEPGNA
jgi:transcription elongation factor GreB